MQSTNTPPKILTPIAQQDGSRATVPLTTSDATRASQSAGFPDLTGLPPEAGGVPPQKPDMNGLLNLISGVPFWTAGGGRFVYDAAFATNAAINGYPRGAVLASADLTGEWVSTAENNVVNPDTVGTGWVPGTFYGQTLLANQTGGTVTLTPAQAAKPVLRITGTLAGNLIVELPAWIRDWTVYNGTSGAFTVSVRTPGRPSVVVPQTGNAVAVRGDGTDVAVSTTDIPLATTTVVGITRLATGGEATQGSLQTVAVTPFGLTQAIPAATNAVAGRVRLPTAGEWAAGATGNVVPNAAQVREALGLKQDNLGYTPVRQGGGSGQMGNTLYLGWTGSKISIQVNASNLGALALESWVQPLLDAKADESSVASRLGGKANVSGQIFTGQIAGTTVTSTGNNFIGGVANVVLAPSNVGNVLFRPNGSASASGQTTISSNGNMTVGGSVNASGGFDTGSSRTVKNIEASFPYGLTEVLAIDPIHFRYTKMYREDDRLVLGFPAEDVRAVLPEAVRETPEAPSPLALQAEQLVPVLWRAVQELTHEVRDLRERLGV